jgi:hypothetical protein
MKIQSVRLSVAVTKPKHVDRFSFLNPIRETCKKKFRFSKVVTHSKTWFTLSIKWDFSYITNCFVYLLEIRFLKFY